MRGFLLAKRPFDPSRQRPEAKTTVSSSFPSVRSSQWTSSCQKKKGLRSRLAAVAALEDIPSWRRLFLCQADTPRSFPMPISWPPLSDPKAAPSSPSSFRAKDKAWQKTKANTQILPRRSGSFISMFVSIQCLFTKTLRHKNWWMPVNIVVCLQPPLEFVIPCSNFQIPIMTIQSRIGATYIQVCFDGSSAP